MAAAGTRAIAKHTRLSLLRQVSTLTQTTCLSQPEVRPYKDVPGPRGLYRIPILGTLLQFHPFTEFTAENNHELLQEMCDSYGPLFRLQLGEDTVIVTDPKDIKTVYLNEGRLPRRPNLGLREVYARQSGIRCLDVATLQGEEWQAVRNPLNKRLVKVDSGAYYLQPQSFVAEDFAQILATQNELSPEEMSELFFKFSSESIGVVCFNKRLGFLSERDQPDPEAMRFLQATKDAFVMLHRSLTGESMTYRLYKDKTYRKYEEAMGVINSFSSRHLLQARNLLNKQLRDGTLNPDEPNLLLSLFSDKTLGEEHVVQVVESLYSGGTDSTAGSVQALFYNLAKNPSKQEKLRQEILSVLPLGQPVTMDTLNKMHYLKACVKESFRILYPSNGILRILPTDVVLSGYKIPAGVRILLCNILTCRNEFADPDQYIPERWLRAADGSLPGDVEKMAVLPFGYGPRNCIGRRFAEQEVYLAAIKVLQRLKIGLEQESWNTPFVYRIFLQPSIPLRFTFTQPDVNPATTSACTTPTQVTPEERQI